MLYREIAWELFRYFVVIAIGEIYLAVFTLILALNRWQTALVLGAGAILIWAAMFTFLEVQRIERASRGLKTEVLPRVKRIIIVESATGEPYPHHEDHAESPGRDQGQLTSNWPGATPLIERLLLRWHRRESRTNARA